MLLIVKCESCGKTLKQNTVESPGAQTVIAQAIQRALIVGAENWNVKGETVTHWDICDECYATETMNSVAIY